MSWPFFFHINCSSDLNNFENTQPSASNFKSFSRTLKQFFPTISQSNFENKIPFLAHCKYAIYFPISANLDYCLTFLKKGILSRYTKIFWAYCNFEILFLGFRFLLLTTTTDKTTWQTAGKQDMLTMILTDDEAATSQSNSNGW